MLIKRLLNRNAAQLNGSNGLCPFPFALVEEEWMKTNTNQENTERIRIMVNYMVAQGEKESGLPFIMHSKASRKSGQNMKLIFKLLIF